MNIPSIFDLNVSKKYIMYGVENLSSGDPVAVRARCGLWESRGDIMNLFVSFFSSFVTSVKACGIVIVIVTRTCVLVTLREGRKKHSPLPALSNTSELGQSMQLWKPGSHKDG